MIQYSIIVTLISITATVITLFFLPALIELKKPADAGPRLINANIPKISGSDLSSPLVDIEAEQIFPYQPAITISSSLYALYALEDLELNF